MVEVLQAKESVGVVQGSGGVMDGARANDDEEATLRIRALDAGDDFMAGIDDGGLGVLGLGQGE